MDINKIDDIKKEISSVREKTIEINDKINDIKLDISSHLADFREQVVTQKHMQENLQLMADVLNKNTESLIEHMARTKMNELAIQELKNISANIDSRLSPLEVSNIEKKAVSNMLKKISFVMGSVATLVSIVYTILNIIK
jgi:chromosome segregation ATPase